MIDAISLRAIPIAVKIIFVYNSSVDQSRELFRRGTALSFAIYGKIFHRDILSNGGPYDHYNYSYNYFYQLQVKLSII